MVSKGLSDGPTTKDRLITEGMRLFAERGFKATTVGGIEAAAGLVPRAGGLYKHFASKRAVFEAGVERHISGTQGMERVIDLMPIGDLRAELTLLVRWLLGELAGEREVVVLIEKEGSAFPELRDRFFEQVVQRGYRRAAEFAQRWLKSIPGGGTVDAEALACLAIGSIVAYRRQIWTFGVDPLDVDEERFVQTFVNTFGLLARAGGGSDD